MFSNTGSLSFYLGIAFIGIAIAGVWFVYYALSRGLIDESKLDKVIDLGKWVIASVAIILSGAIISDGFKEREQDVKELEFFDKYVATVTQAEGIEQRWLLCEYFASVSPPGEMRSSWQNYQKVIEPAYKSYKQGKAEIAKLSAKDSLSNDELKKLSTLREKTHVLEQSLVGHANSEAKVLPETNNTVYIQYGKTAGRDGASEVMNVINDFGYKAPGIEFIENIKTNEIRYFRKSDEEAAMALQALLSNHQVETKIQKAFQFEGRTKPGTVEIWLK